MWSAWDLACDGDRHRRYQCNSFHICTSKVTINNQLLLRRLKPTGGCLSSHFSSIHSPRYLHIVEPAELANTHASNFSSSKPVEASREFLNCAELNGESRKSSSTFCRLVSPLPLTQNDMKWEHNTDKENIPRNFGVNVRARLVEAVSVYRANWMKETTFSTYNWIIEFLRIDQALYTINAIGKLVARNGWMDVETLLTTIAIRPVMASDKKVIPTLLASETAFLERSIIPDVLLVCHLLLVLRIAVAESLSLASELLSAFFNLRF